MGQNSNNNQFDTFSPNANYQPQQTPQAQPQAQPPGLVAPTNVAHGLPVSQTGYGATLPAHLGGGANPNYDPMGSVKFAGNNPGYQPTAPAQPAPTQVAAQGLGAGMQPMKAPPGWFDVEGGNGVPKGGYDVSNTSPEAQFWRQGREADWQRSKGAGNGKRWYGNDIGLQDSSTMGRGGSSVGGGGWI